MDLSCQSVHLESSPCFIALQIWSNGWYVTIWAVPSCSSNQCWPSPRCALILAPKWKTSLAAAALSAVVASAPPWGMTLTRQDGGRQENTSCTQTNLRPTPVVFINNIYDLSKLVDFTNEAMYHSMWHSPKKYHPLSLPSSKSTFSQPVEEKGSDVVRIGSIIIFILSKLWKGTFLILWDVILLVRLQEKFDIDYSWEWRGKNGISSKHRFFNPFIPNNDKFQISPAASPEILHHTVRRTWLFIACSDERRIIQPITTTSLTHFSLKVWENVSLSRKAHARWIHWSPDSQCCRVSQRIAPASKSSHSQITRVRQNQNAQLISLQALTRPPRLQLTITCWRSRRETDGGQESRLAWPRSKWT